jgi:hypothetical protein
VKPLQAEAAGWANYRSQHMIPVLNSYGLCNFKDFFAKRRELMLEKLKSELPTA